ncbi:MAG: protein kinase [Planctomycetes bacterium]|nr:protein kinase [Planctomycetota bacterium]
MKTTATREQRLSSWLEAWFEARESGSNPEPSSFCTEEDLRAEFCELVAEAEGLDFLADDLRERREAPTQDPLLGRVIDGKLRIERLLGRGGMGAVYLARHLGLERDVALKFLGELRFGRQDAHARFEREARALARLRHPSIVPVLDTGALDERPWLAMELLRGCDVARWLRALPEVAVVPVPTPGAARDAWRACSSPELAHEGENAPRWSRPFFELVAALGADIARGLEVAHAAQVVHRDVKPSNLWLDAEGRACLADFGLARLGDEATLTRDDGPLGTPVYMAPEQLGRSAEALDGRADVYGLGATLYHLLTRRLPFEGGSAEVLTRLRHEDPPPPRALSPSIPRDLEAIVLHAMEKRPADRYASARELADDLEAFVERREVRARRPSAVRRTWRRIARRPARALAVLGFVLAFAVAWLWISSAERAAFVERAARVDERRAALPALVTLEHDPRSRWLRPYRDAAELGPVLDEILAFAPDDAITRWFRANFRSQHGEIEGARADLDHLRTRGNATPLLEQLAQTLVSSEEEARWKIPALKDLAAPQTALDAFLAGYIALRYRSFGPALQHFDAALERAREEGQTKLWPIRDVRSIAALGALDAARALEDAYAVEGALGRATARTRHVIGAALYLQGVDDRAEEALRESLALHPEGHAPHHNLGVLLARNGRRAEAREHLELALARRPEVWNTRWELARLFRDQGEFDRARELLTAQIEDPTPGIAAKVRLALLNLEVEAWRELSERGEESHAQECLQRALAHRDALRAEKRLGFVERQKLAVAATRLDWMRGEIDAARAFQSYVQLWVREEAFLATRPREEGPFLRDPYLRENLARAARELRRSDEAVLFLRQALALETCPASVRGLLIELLLERREAADALRELVLGAELFRRDSRRELWIRSAWRELPAEQRASLGPELHQAGLVEEHMAQELAIPSAPAPARADR